MSELEQVLKKIDSKFRLLEFTRDDTPRIQERKDLKATERLQKTLEKQINSVHEQMVEIQALRIEKGEELNDVRKWSLEIEKQVAEYKEITQGFRKTIKNLLEKASREEAKLEEEKAEEEKCKRRHEEETKMQIKRDFEKNMEEERNKSVKKSSPKLPKLTMTKFQGTHLDWLRFWSQFNTEIDKATITQVASSPT